MRFLNELVIPVLEMFMDRSGYRSSSGPPQQYVKFEFLSGFTALATLDIILMAPLYSVLP
ncbi:hypothetical protein [Acidiplasma cupricumulans]|uniref:hypothetical protein n=1 Tax=Acidiplasma cupricumulans TaxID=312540 RepID=UPI000785BE52|nr:hypothetical protein [Acidiplasma cupricumulans]